MGDSAACGVRMTAANGDFGQYGEVVGPADAVALPNLPRHGTLSDGTLGGFWPIGTKHYVLYFANALCRRNAVFPKNLLHSGSVGSGTSDSIWVICNCWWWYSRQIRDEDRPPFCSTVIDHQSLQLVKRRICGDVKAAGRKPDVLARHHGCFRIRVGLNFIPPRQGQIGGLGHQVIEITEGLLSVALWQAVDSRHDLTQGL
jgi:hypothetical protein